jgi:hypothetical protein
MANVWDGFGKLIGSVRRSENGDANTYDNQGQPLGKVRQTGTYEVRGDRINQDEVP